MRFLYSLALYLLSPFIWWRVWREWLPTHSRWERLGRVPYETAPVIWVHAASVGEVMTARPLVQALETRYPSHKIVMTTMTATGANQVASLFEGRICHHFLPLDFPGPAKRFVRHVRPALAIVIETELWPNLLAECQHHDVPLALVNGRLSTNALQRYQRIRPLMRDTLAHFDWLGIKDRTDLERFKALDGPVSRMEITGGLKFDLRYNGALEKVSEDILFQCDGRFIWVAASTHEGEDAALIDAHARLRERYPGALMILVPRHPQRFDAIAQLIEDSGQCLARRSRGDGITSRVSVYLGDTMGELMGFYAVASVAFVGGSLVPVGGHNLLEPAALAVPVVTGPHLENFSDIADLLEADDALVRVATTDELVAALAEAATAPEQARARGRRGLMVVERHRGALEATLNGLERLLPGGVSG
ncbi:lipid IV(A) 3-deoxy-D-manno-octulosonic acid transferase [Larsenimonas salina]|uniref:lipid IV(A) 3-deoxy-D-manno-octulosonic acid transferase n=1 Tax=Larsenimonas salina TaxID=1295565 RepID=UPI0020740D63|nr:lipid IV(A) 3-deoxy-D-manno-octulosonic acid transferase [Larsenimonas salina]